MREGKVVCVLPSGRYHVLSTSENDRLMDAIKETRITIRAQARDDKEDQMSGIVKYLEKARDFAVLALKVYAAAVAGDWVGAWGLFKALLAFVGINI